MEGRGNARGKCLWKLGNESRSGRRDNVILFHNAPPPLLEVMPPNPFRQFLDRFGAAGSLLCAIHCALLPALLALAPSLGLSFWLGDGVEQSVVVFVTFLGLFSLIWGYR